MRLLKFISLGLCILGLVSCNLNNGTDNKTSGGGTVSPENKTIDLSLFKNSKDLRFSSYE